MFPAKSGGYGADEASLGEWRSGKVLPPLESRNRPGEREPRMARDFSGDSGRPERREMALASSESGVDKWERRGPLPPTESTERKSRGGFGSRSGSGNFGGPPSRAPPRESFADTGEWRSARPLAPAVRSDGSISRIIEFELTGFRHPSSVLSFLGRLPSYATQEVDVIAS